MVDAVVGAVIMGVATTSLLMSVEVVEDAFRAAGRYPASEVEDTMLSYLGKSLLDRHEESGDIQMSQQIISGLELIDSLEEAVIDFLPSQYQQNNDL